MEKRKECLNTLRLCRFCLSQDATLTSLYERDQASKNSVPLSLKILSCVSIEVYPSDKMPSYICKRCKFFMELSYEYKQICRQADEKILQFVQTGATLASVQWPQPLLITFNGGKHNKEVTVVKTVEGGATIQVLAEGSDMSEDDDGNVYDIKIGDDSGEGTKNARVKVVTSDQKKPKTQPSKGFTTISKLTRHVREHASKRAYPCKYCEKSFLKSHHYTRHLRLKHGEIIRSSRGPFGSSDQFKCEQCDYVFTTQDELIYHSAIHATQNLTCPLCQEKFDNVDAVTAHIKSHANGIEFMCDLCELVFTSKQKLDKHMADAHQDDMENEDENENDSEEMEGEDEEDDNSINLKEEDGEMVVEIKKPNEFMLPNLQDDIDDKMDNTNSEDSESEQTYTELSTVDTLAIVKNDVVKPNVPEKTSTAVGKSTPSPKPETQGQANILRKAEEAKRKAALQKAESVTDKKEKANSKPESGANDKSLRLLEKELQDLKRTNVRSEAVKTPVKPVEMSRNRRPQLHTSTPKTKSITEEKKTPVLSKLAVTEKKTPERRIVTKENKEPKETKSNNGATKDEKENKDKETTKSAVKNGNPNTSDKSIPEEGIRRSTRPSKIKDYAKMIRDGSQDSNEENVSDADDDYKEADKSAERGKTRRSSVKATQKATPVAVDVATSSAPVTPAVPRKRGRPRKEPAVPAKIKKDNEDEEEETRNIKDCDDESNANESSNPEEETIMRMKKESPAMETSEQKPTPTNMLVSPTGQTLKKVPVRNLPPGVKALPLPPNARPFSSDVCEMQIGKKMVKVQKIVMTKAEVEAMAKQGLVEIKDGTMMLKQGIKLPADTSMLKTTLIGEDSPTKVEKGAPTRCSFDDDS